MIYVWCGKLHKQTANEYALCSCNFLKGGFRQCFKMHACMIYCIFRHKIGRASSFYYIPILSRYEYMIHILYLEMSVSVWLGVVQAAVFFL